MPAAPTVEKAEWQPEQRAHQRYPLRLEVAYKLSERGRMLGSGSGQTLNISSGGALFSTDQPVPSGVSIEVVVSWPFLLEGICPLKLVIRGHVVRCQGTNVAISATHHEFRTAGLRTAREQKALTSERSLA